MANNNGGIWKWAAGVSVTFLSAVLLLGIPVVIAEGNKPSRTEVVEIVQTQSPYFKDEELIKSTLSRLEIAVEHLQGSATQLIQMDSRLAQVEVLLTNLKLEIEGSSSG